MWQKKKRCMCQLCGPTVHIKSCDNCRGKHSWWKAISQIILATIRECGGVKWRFHMQMCRWEGSGTLPNSSDPHSPALVRFTWDAGAQRERLALLGRRKERWIKSSINHVEAKQKRFSRTESMFFYEKKKPSPLQGYNRYVIIFLLFFSRKNHQDTQIKLTIWSPCKYHWFCSSSSSRSCLCYPHHY